MDTFARLRVEGANNIFSNQFHVQRWAVWSLWNKSPSTSAKRQKYLVDSEKSSNFPAWSRVDHDWIFIFKYTYHLKTWKIQKNVHGRRYPEQKLCQLSVKSTRKPWTTEAVALRLRPCEERTTFSSCWNVIGSSLAQETVCNHGTNTHSLQDLVVADRTKPGPPTNQDVKVQPWVYRKNKTSVAVL